MFGREKIYVCYFVAMWFESSNRSRRRLLYLSLVVLLVTTLLQVEVEAIRVLPAGNDVANVEFKSKEDLFNKYFSGRSTSFGPNNTTKKGFDEIKRRVPSCPDPLHN